MTMSTYVNWSRLRSVVRGDLVVPRSKLTISTEKLSCLWSDPVEHTIPPTVHDPSPTMTKVLEDRAILQSKVHPWWFRLKLGSKDCSCEHKHPCLLTKVAHMSHMAVYHLHHLHLLSLVQSFVVNLKPWLFGKHFPFLPDWYSTDCRTI